MRQDDAGKRLDRVEDDHHAVVDAAAEVPAKQAEQDPADDRDQHRRDRGDEGDARAVDDAREQVAAEMVGAEQVILRRSLQHAREVLLCVVVRREQGPKTTRNRKIDHDDKAQRAQRLFQHLPQHGDAIERALPTVRRPSDEFHRSTSRLAQLDAGVQIGVRDIGQQVGHHEHDGDDQDARPDDRVVAS